MLEELNAWDPTTCVAEDIRIDDLTITFKRTVRVPDNDQITTLPPDLGAFPLFKVDDYAKSLPDNMARKGGLFLPMYQREALWINFTSTRRYAIKIYVGGINAVSGEPSIPNAATALRRRNLLKNGESLQDYIAIPGQLWLDGIAVKPGQVRQFVAMPVGTGHSVEAQMTGQETTAGIQFEITRLNISSDSPGKMIQVFVRNLMDQRITCNISREGTIKELKDLIEEEEGILVEEQRLIFNGAQMKDDRRLSECGIINHSTLHLLLRLRGGGPPPTELSIADGGRITQGIVSFAQREYRKTIPVTFNVQILDSASFEQVTGKKPPKSPVTAKTYADCGYPFFSMYEEPTTVSGDFSKIRSVAQIDNTPDQPLSSIPIIDVVTREVIHNWICEHCGQKNNTAAQQCDGCLAQRSGSVVSGRVGILNPGGPNEPLKLEWEMVDEIRQMHTAF